jgi:hypothetical protein
MGEKAEPQNIERSPTLLVIQGEKGYGVLGVSMRTGVSSDLKRGSIKRQSDIMREARKSRQEEHEEERKRKQSYYRRVTG